MIFIVEFSGCNEVILIVSCVFGEIIVVLDGNEFVVLGSFIGFEGNFDVMVVGGFYIYIGYVGENGGIIFELSFNFGILFKSGMFEVIFNIFMLFVEEMDVLMECWMYVNIYMIFYFGGEIWG